MAVASCITQASNINCDNYSLGIAIMFLTEVDPGKHHDVIVKYVDESPNRQKQVGGWGIRARSFAIRPKRSTACWESGWPRI